MAFDIRSLAAPGVRTIEPYQPGKPIAELERELGISGAIKLASNENPLGPSPSAVGAARRALDDIARYPDGGGFALKRVLSSKLGVAPAQVTLGNGSNDILELVARAFVTSSDEVVYAQHAFAVYELVTRAVGAKAVIVPARDWGHDLPAMQRAITPRTRLVFIANPNNPTGTWVGRRALEEFLQALPAHALVVVDEAYFEYVEELDYPNAAAWMAQFPNLIVARTFSKAYGLAGLRLGYGVSSADIADYLNRVRQPFNVNSAAAAAAEAALADEAHMRRSVALNRDGYRRLTAGLGSLGLSFIPSVGNFIAIDFGRPAAPIYDALLRQGVIVRPIGSYGMPNHLRVTIGLPEENERFLSTLAAVLKEVGQRRPAGGIL
jgi:histidinol-phosphate aminotransferase